MKRITGRNMEYKDFIKTKIIKDIATGFEPEQPIHEMLFDFQKAIVKWALRRGRAAIFADTGLGKTLMQLEWAKHIHDKTGKNILIVAPLAVSLQTQREGKKTDIKVNVCRKQPDIKAGINITNYEMIQHFEADKFIGIVLDESSILKSYSGKIRNYIIEMFVKTPYRLACTATPAPNDYMELGNHSEFLSVMSRVQMLANFFVHDGTETQKWRLKGHAQDEYWKWMSTWAVVLKMPSDLGFKDDGFILPELKIHEHIIESRNEDYETLFPMPVQGLNESRKARKLSLEDRIQKAKEIIGESEKAHLIWCDYNNESELLKKEISGSTEVKGSNTIQYKEKSMIDFINGNIKRLVTKPSIFGFGMNLQHCNNVIFSGIGYSYEQFYQAIRRCWRFGQESPVNVHVILSELELDVLNSLKRKEKQAMEMSKNMVAHVADISKKELNKKIEHNITYKTNESEGKGWKIYLGDSCQMLYDKFEIESIDYSIFSPPFADLYCYSDSIYDLGNCEDYDQFFEHFKYIIKRLFKLMKSGRLISIHCTDIPSLKERDGVIGLKDFPGDLIRAFIEKGFIYHSRHLIWKDPLIEATRTKALSLMHKQIVKDSSMCRAGLPDYLLTFRKPGENKEMISHDNGFETYIGTRKPREIGIKYSHVTWQKYASPVWMDINQSRTLQKTSAREEKDEKHICPLQLDVIDRALELWSNPGDLVLSPFAGIGSEGYAALLKDRRFVGIELKESYYKQACGNLRNALIVRSQQDIFEDENASTNINGSNRTRTESGKKEISNISQSS